MKLFDATFEARMRRQGLSNQEMSEVLDAVADMEAERDRYREALTEIVDADSVDLVLDPTWPQRIARLALAKNQEDAQHG